MTSVGTGNGPPVVAVVGATATGKSDLAVALAERLGAQVVNADSMQLYRGMDIGTAKLTEAQWRGVPHHLLDLWDVRQAANVAEYQRLARQVVDRLRAADVIPVLVGGSGLYVRAVLDDLRFPGTDPVVRARLEAELAQAGPEVMHARLAALAPAAAVAILPTNGRRIVRALEVVELTGGFTATLPALDPVYPTVRIGLQAPRPELDARIAARVDAMWRAGLVAEVRALAEQGLREGPTASRALGYAQVLRFLDGRCSEEHARAETVRLTKRFARRQDAWFGREPVTWLAYDAPDLLARTLDTIRSASIP